VRKVLHIIENFNGQAIELWLYHTLRHFAELDERIDWTFYAILGRPGTMDDAVRALGGKIIYSPVKLNNNFHFFKALRKVIDDGKYEILHSHHDILSAIYFFASAGLPLKKRIIHIHNTSLSIPTSSNFKKFLLHEPMRQTCLQWANNLVGVSGVALDAFLKGKESIPGRDMVIHCGIDMAPFHLVLPGRHAFLQSFGLLPDSKVLLFVGRMTHYKNPCFVIEVLSHISKLDSTVCAIFAGSGPLEDEVRKLAKHKSLESRVKVLGWHGDVPALMRSCDMLIWPGLEEPREGLGLGVVEAQAAGLPVLMSRSVPEEAIVVRELVDVLPLVAGADVWAEWTLQILSRGSTNREGALTALEGSSFAISQSAANIRALYEI
jgi:glycosyltransferase involved in cell wall biosynthesis